MASLLAQQNIGRVEEDVRTRVQTQRVRITEFFHDYDRLRSGFVTAGQFKRVLDTSGIELTDSQVETILKNYDTKGDGRINYRLFTQNINKAFNPNLVSVNPWKQTNDPPEYLGTWRSLHSTGDRHEARVAALIDRLADHYKYRGISLQTQFEDFDRLHVGVVSSSQFLRAFPWPNDVSVDDVKLLAFKYADPQKPQHCNYLNLHNDIVTVAEAKQKAEDTKFPQAEPFVLEPIPVQESVSEILAKIRLAVYKNGIRTPEYFRDNDGLRSGTVTETQFSRGLDLAIGKYLTLTPEEVQKLTDFYRVPATGRIDYRSLCHVMEHAFNVDHLEKKPLVEVSRPPRGGLARYAQCLTEEEEGRVVNALRQMATDVRRRNLMVYPYFKDFDRSNAYTRGLTKSQFGRVLQFLSLPLLKEDFRLLCRKFENPVGGDINYVAFVQAIDSQYHGFTTERDADRRMVKTPWWDLPPDTSVVDINNVMARIRSHVIANRLRIQAAFEDFDPLRSGRVTKSQFRRGLQTLGLSLLGSVPMTDGQFEVVANQFLDRHNLNHVVWTSFKDAIENSFTPKDLEKDPTRPVEPIERFVLPRPGTNDWSKADGNLTENYDAVVFRFRSKMAQRRINPWPCFQDFDRHHNGHITRKQFRQCLGNLQLDDATDTEIACLEARFIDDMGFNYRGFIAEVCPTIPDHLRYIDAKKTVRLAMAAKEHMAEPGHVASSTDQVLAKIKARVARRRVRIYEFLKDYDSLHSGRCLKTHFRRALDVCGFELKESEISLLEHRFQSPVDSDYVDYLPFVKEVESIFTAFHLEKAPLVTPSQFRPPPEVDLNKLSAEDIQRLDATMARISAKVRKERMQLFPLFKDMDVTNNGTGYNGVVSASQFRRVLTELGLGDLFDDFEFGALKKRFGELVGLREDVNYLAFCFAVYNQAGFNPRLP